MDDLPSVMTHVFPKDRYYDRSNNATVLTDQLQEQNFT